MQIRTIILISLCFVGILGLFMLAVASEGQAEARANETARFFQWRNFGVDASRVSVPPGVDSLSVLYTYDGLKDQQLYIQSGYAHITRFELAECLNASCTESSLLENQETDTPAHIPTVTALHQVGKRYLLTISPHHLSSEALHIELFSGPEKIRWFKHDFFTLAYVVLVLGFGLMGLVYGAQFFNGLSIYYASCQACIAALSIVYHGYNYAVDVFTPQLSILLFNLLLPITVICILNVSQDVLRVEIYRPKLRAHFKIMIVGLHLCIPLMIFDIRWLEFGCYLYIAFCLMMAARFSWKLRSRYNSSARLLFLSYMLLFTGFVGDVILHAVTLNEFNPSTQELILFGRTYHYLIFTLTDSIFMCYLYITYVAEDAADKKYLECATNDGTANQESEFESRLTAVIAEHLHDPEFNVERLGSYMHVSVSTLSRLTRKELSCSPAELIRQRRMSHAAELVKQNRGISISSLAAQVGYADPSYFARQYRKRFGMESI